MRVVGMVTVVVVAIVVVVGLFVGIRSIPDVKRYLKIRSM